MSLDDEPPFKPFGLAGLLASLLGIAVLTLGVLAAGFALFSLGELALAGQGHLLDLLRLARDTPRSAREGAVELAGFLTGSVIYLAVILAILILARLKARAQWRALVAWAPFRADWRFAGLLVLGLVYGVVASALIGYLHPASRDWFTFPKAPLAVFASLVLIVVLAPLAEELLFRGWIYTALRQSCGFSVALIASASLFALAHWENTHLYALAVLPVGFALGYVRERTGSTRASTLFHAVFNLMGWLLTFMGKA
jgi:membrane protease YdiL (CAAX protease family)